MNTTRIISTRCAVLTVLIFMSGILNAQDPRSFSPEQIQRFREMRERSRGEEGRGRGEGFDFSRRSRGGEGGGEDWRSRGREAESERDRRQGGFEGGGNPGDGENGSRSPEGRSGAAATAKTERKPKPRFTVDLPTLFNDVDSDRDGQVGLYEWRKSKRSLTDFSKIDLNGDGFLTPTELVQAGSIPAASTANIAAVAPSGGTAQAPAANVPPASVAAAQPPQVQIAGGDASALVVVDVDLSSPQAQQAKRLFDILDRDRDGNVSAAEWSRGTRIRPQFEQAGVDLSQPMSSAQFVSHYVQLNSPKS